LHRFAQYISHWPQKLPKSFLDRHIIFCDFRLANREVFQKLWPERDMVPQHGEVTQA
jgi:hypothetical protein